MEPRKILLIRHGETAHNKNHIVQPADTPLSETGFTQAGLLAKRLSASCNVGSILCSDLLRAKQTAHQIQQQVACDLSFSPLLQERNFGDLRGLPYGKIGVDIFARNYVPPGGESWQDFHHRVSQAWQQVVIASQQCSADLVVVTHGLVCKALVENHLCYANVPERWSNTSVTEIAVGENYQLLMLNNTAHLTEHPSGNTGAARA